MTILKWILIGLGGLSAAGVLFIMAGLIRASRTQPKTQEVKLGVEGGELTPCPGTPNCVSTQASPSDETHYVPPIAYEGSREEAMAKLTEWIEQREDATVVERRDDYLRGVFTSRVFGFRDDLEVYFPESEKVAHLRSASRVGQGDLGVNRKRYQAVRSVMTGE